jgi:hypothetical protein
MNNQHISNKWCLTLSQQCRSHFNGAGLVGRDISARDNNCHECCSTDRCNNQLCIHHKRMLIFVFFRKDSKSCFLFTTVNKKGIVNLLKQSVCYKFVSLKSESSFQWSGRIIFSYARSFHIRNFFSSCICIKTISIKSITIFF